MNIAKGEIYLAKTKDELRPVLILNCEKLNDLEIVKVIPLTTLNKNNLLEVFEYNNKKNYAMRNILYINPKCLINKLGMINNIELMKTIEILSENYINAHSKLKLRCTIDKYEWEATWNNLKKGEGCPECVNKRRDYTINIIKEKLKEINPNIEILSNKYINANVKLKCKCLIDGYQWETAWSNLSQGCGCPKCAGKLKLSLEEVKEKLKEMNPNIEILSKEYKGYESKLYLKCKIDNYEWQAKWGNLSQGQGCPKCYGNIKLTLEEVKEKLKDVNPNIKILSKEYINNLTNVTCKCLICENEWQATWSNLSRGKGCPECAKEKLEGSYIPILAERNKEKWLKENASIYVIECWNNEEHFYKIGITSRDVKKRFISHQMPYNYKILKLIKTNKYKATYLEKELHKQHKNFKYTPKIEFGGYRECFINIDNDLIDESVKKVI